MRIGIFTDSYRPAVSGVVTSVMMLREGLEALGHEVYIICTTAKEIPDHDDLKVIRLRGIPFPFRSLGEYRMVFFANRAIKRIARLNLDIIHVHTEFTIGQLGIRTAKKLHIPLVYTLHTLYEDYIHHISPFFEQHFKGEIVQIIRTEVKRIIERADATFVPSEKIRKLVEDTIHCEGNIHIVPTGLDLTPFSKDNFSDKEINHLKDYYGIKEDEFVLLFVGRLAPEKNLTFLINTFKELQKEVNNVRFLIIGGGVYEEEIKAEIANLNIGNKIIMAGFIKWSNLGIYYQLGDCFLNASTTETQGLTFIEALASSKIILSVKDEAVDAVLTDGYNGFYYADAASLIKVVKKVIADKELLKIMEANAYQSAKPYSKENYTEKALAIYKTLVK